MSLDDVPIKPVMNVSFDELVAEALSREENHIEFVSDRPKQPFLRKGTGLQRFVSPKKADHSSPVRSIPKQPRAKRNAAFPRNINNKKIQRSCGVPMQQKAPTITRHVSSHQSQRPQSSHPSRPSHLPHPNEIRVVPVRRDEDRLQVLQKLLKTIQMKQEELKKNPKDDGCTTDADPGRGREEVYTIPKQLEVQEIDQQSCSSSTKSSDDMMDSFDRGNFNFNPLSKPRLNSALDLKRKIESLEERLRNLDLMCQKDIINLDGGLMKDKFLIEMNTITRQLDKLNDKFEILETQLIRKNVLSQENRSKLESNLPRVHSKVTSKQNSNQKIVENGNRMVLNSGDEIIRTINDEIIYKFKNGTKQTTYPDGSRLIEFPSGQREKISVDGTKTAVYPNGTQRIIHPDGSEEITTVEGTKIRIACDGTETVDLPCGGKEVRTDKFKRREYLDGTIKTLYLDGTVETRYPNGRIRVKPFISCGKQKKATTTANSRSSEIKKT
ncbi:spindle assembly abnormal 4 [Brevipalpus obovatus]|uniref:spindle assembly abnormal 4 n=1 Tax=Brevipalpus obovatus TaxID=246614 RepID=UPI003D9F9A1E